MSTPPMRLQLDPVVTRARRRGSGRSQGKGETRLVETVVLALIPEFEQVKVQSMR